MSRWIAIGVLSLATLGCGDSTKSTGSAESAQTAPEEAAQTAGAVEEGAEGAAAEAAQAVTGTRDIAGLSVDVRDDGTITLAGTDRWGDRIDTTYGSLEYLTHAVPVLKRKITDEQASALDVLVEELGRAGGENAPVEAAGGDGEG